VQELLDFGWMRTPGEPCSLDCQDPEGWLRSYRGREIILCSRHAWVLESGKRGNTYSGAPLPADSRATEWPWLPARLIDPALLA
jgi:hypothetical protein